MQMPHATPVFNFLAKVCFIAGVLLYAAYLIGEGGLIPYAYPRMLVPTSQGFLFATFILWLGGNAFKPGGIFGDK